MTEDRDPIQRYLDQLRLSLRIPEVGRILVEAEDHLRAATAAKVAGGMSEQRAQEAAVAGFGPVHEIVYAHQTRHGRLAAMLADLGISAWRVIASYLLAAFALDLGGILGQPHYLMCGSQDHCAVLFFPGAASTAVELAESAATGAAGVAVLVAYFAVRRFQRRRGRVWSIPLGGFFPLFVVLASVTVSIGILLLYTTGTTPVPRLAWIVFLALGMVVTYGWRMGRMLLAQERDHELA
jgi:amino acid transporter